MYVREYGKECLFLGARCVAIREHIPALIVVFRLFEDEQEEVFLQFKAGSFKNLSPKFFV